MSSVLLIVRIAHYGLILILMHVFFINEEIGKTTSYGTKMRTENEECKNIDTCISSKSAHYGTKRIL